VLFNNRAGWFICYNALDVRLKVNAACSREGTLEYLSRIFVVFARLKSRHLGFCDVTP